MAEQHKKLWRELEYTGFSVDELSIPWPKTSLERQELHERQTMMMQCAKEMMNHFARYKGAKIPSVWF